MVEKIKVHDNPNVTEQYFSKFIGLMSDGHDAHLTLGAQRIVRTKTGPSDPDAQPGVYITGRFVLSPDALLDLSNALNSLLEKMGAKQRTGTEH